MAGFSFTVDLLLPRQKMVLQGFKRLFFATIIFFDILLYS
jgi:hypothetical protein